MKQQKGITLVALIITIIVMLILVAVTLSIALGDNGIINNAQDAKENYASEQTKELNSANDVSVTIDGTPVTGINDIVDAAKGESDEGDAE